MHVIELLLRDKQFISITSSYIDFAALISAALNVPVSHRYCQVRPIKVIHTIVQNWTRFIALRLYSQHRCTIINLSPKFVVPSGLFQEKWAPGPRVAPNQGADQTRGHPVAHTPAPGDLTTVLAMLNIRLVRAAHRLAAWRDGSLKVSSSVARDYRAFIFKSQSIPASVFLD